MVRCTNAERFCIAASVIWTRSLEASPFVSGEGNRNLSAPIWSISSIFDESLLEKLAGTNVELRKELKKLLGSDSSENRRTLLQHGTGPPKYCKVLKLLPK